MATNIHPFQILNGQQIHGGRSLLEREHFYTALQDDPVTMMETVNAVMDFNLGESLASQIASRAVERIPAGAEGTFRWAIDYFVDGNYECVAVYTDSVGATEMTSADKLEARTMVYMDFQGAPFGHTEVISGMNPENDLLLIKEVFTPSPGISRYAVEMAYSKGPESFFAYEQVAPGTRWAKSHGAVSDRMSYDGFGVNFKTPVMAEGHMSSFRMKFQFHGKDMNWTPKYFYLPDAKTGKVTSRSPKLWMTTVEYEFLSHIRKATSNILMYGRSNKWNDNTWGNYDANNGYEIRMGSGWNEQKLSSNRHYYTAVPSLKEIEEIILAAVVNKTGQRKVIIKAGEYGLAELSKMVMRAYGSSNYTGYTLPWATDTSGRNFKWSGNDVFVNMGQVRGFATIANIECQFVLDPLKDDASRNNIKMPGLPGLASSYEYDIVGFGTTTEDSNMRVVRRQGEEPMFASVEGIRGSIAKQATSFNNPSRVSTAVDMFELHYYDMGLGAKLADPTKWISYYPNILMYKF